MVIKEEIMIKAINSLEYTRCKHQFLILDEVGWIKCPNRCGNNEFRVHCIEMGHKGALDGLKRTFCLECLNEYEENDTICEKCGVKR